MRKGFFLSVIIAFMIMFLSAGCTEKQVKKEEQPQVSAEQKEVKPPTPPETKIGEEGIKGGQMIAKVEETSKLQDINFDFDKYNIRDDAKSMLEQNAAWLKKNPAVRIQIEGHCDERGSSEYNLALGERRAKSTKDYLVSLGIEAGRLLTISFGKEKPLDPGHNEDAWAKNRRAHFVIISK